MDIREQDVLDTNCSWLEVGWVGEWKLMNKYTRLLNDLVSLYVGNNDIKSKDAKICSIEFECQVEILVNTLLGLSVLSVRLLNE